jgi:hypothetical protein
MLGFTMPKSGSWGSCRLRLEGAGLLEKLLHTDLQWGEGESVSFELEYFYQGIPCPSDWNFLALFAAYEPRNYHALLSGNHFDTRAEQCRIALEV